MKKGQFTSMGLIGSAVKLLKFFVAVAPALSDIKNGVALYKKKKVEPIFSFRVKEIGLLENIYFVKSWRKLRHPRKPFAGFNPYVFKKLQNLHGAQDPTLEYLKTMEPVGAWSREVVSPNSPGTEPIEGSRCAIHFHVFYLDQVKEVLDRLAINSINPSLYVTFPPNLDKRLLVSEFESYIGVTQFIQLKENRGRDIGPFFSDLPHEFFANHDLVAHVHTKKSLDLNNPIIGKAWADFCLDNLIGFGYTPMMDKVVKHFVENKKVGIIYPDDPNVMGWGENYEIAMNILKSENVPKETELFDFPIGNFFFARPAALEHLLAKNFETKDWPEEPIPYDGTILHALERLIGIVPMMSGFTTSVTNVKDLSR